MRKTTRLLWGVAFVLALVTAAGLMAGGPAWRASSIIFAALAGSFAWLAGAGRMTLARQQRIGRDEPDLFVERNSACSERAVREGAVPRPSGLRRWLARRLFGHTLMVGDTVRVESLEAIRRTLDANGCLDGLPFMPEMEAFCGRTMRVYRVVDKIYDYGRSRLMRRIDDSVLLVALRCDGSAHDGCQAACYLIWKSAWLQQVEPGAAAIELIPAAIAPRGRVTDEVFSCQYVRLTAASRPMRQFGFRAIVAPLVVGNVTLGAFLLALQTRCFNALQAWRNGVGYPSMPVPNEDKSIQGDVLQPGDWVRVKAPAELALAMNRQSKHRGLWFDRDMLKHSGQPRRVLGRIETIIDIHSGKMIPMKTPCIVLDGVDYSGEFQGFGEQHDYLYWREVWLKRIDEPSAQAALRSAASAK